MTTARQITVALKGRWHGSYGMASCPSHLDGKTPALKISDDPRNLRTLTKNSPAVATGAHISIIGHITRDELLRYLDDTEAANGFGNRFLWVCVRRSKALPEGGHLSDGDLAPIIREVADALAYGRDLGELRRNDEARAIWRAVYEDLSEGRPGLLGAMIARAEAQVMRLACIYALLDRCPTIGKEHLLAEARHDPDDISGDKMNDLVGRLYNGPERAIAQTIPQTLDECLILARLLSTKYCSDEFGSDWAGDQDIRLAKNLLDGLERLAGRAEA